jgi:hypothetical protein
VVHVAHEFAQYPGKLAVFGCADMSAAINPQELDLEACRVCPPDITCRERRIIRAKVWEAIGSRRVGQSSQLSLTHTFVTATVTGHKEHVRCTGPKYMTGLSPPDSVS